MMNRILSLKAFMVVFSIMLICNAFAQPTPPAGATWEPVPELTDEFDAWDDTKWRYELWFYDEPCYMSASNGGVADGCLWIKADIRESAKFPERWFRTSRIYSRAAISYPMYIECSMKASNLSVYNTFWLNDGDANNRDEIDICENVSNPIDNDPHLPYMMNSQYFIVKDGVEERSTIVNTTIPGVNTRVADFDNRNLSDGNASKGVKWHEAFHTLGLYWVDENHMIFYINGEVAGRDTTTWDFTRELFVIWDMWTQNHDGGIETKERVLAQSDSMRTMYIDWVKTYKLNDPNSISEKAEVKFELFPNPAKEVLNIQMQSQIKDDAQIFIYSNVGQLLQTAELNEGNNQITIADLPPGLYVMRIRNGEDESSELFSKE